MKLWGVLLMHCKEVEYPSNNGMQSGWTVCLFENKKSAESFSARNNAMTLGRESGIVCPIELSIPTLPGACSGA